VILFYFTATNQTGEKKICAALKYNVARHIFNADCSKRVSIGTSKRERKGLEK
jgi:hypothetical protein